MKNELQLVIPLAGEGERFKEEYGVPKPLIPVLGEPMITLAFRTLNIPHEIAIFIIRENHDVDNKLTIAIQHIAPDAKIIRISEKTDGPCSTAELAVPFLDLQKPLVIANCDQVMRWDGHRFLRHCTLENYDGALVTYHETTPKNSYARLNENGEVVEVREKTVISNVSLNGIHYWKKAQDFVVASKEMKENNDRTNGEFYIAPSYNYLINRKKTIGIYHIPNEQHWAIGTPEDLERYKKYTGQVV